ncbi:MAG: hypothetical protein RI544_07110, partial [Haloquadratum sp.]|nr:hypothetical protein [Haloquadratum sp.]
MSGSTLALRHPVLRITFWMCLSAIILIIITPTATAADGPSLEFNQSSYELNDTVGIEITNLTDVNATQILVSIFTSEEKSELIFENIDNPGNLTYTTKNTVNKYDPDSNQSKISKEDIIYSNHDGGSGFIDNISVNKNKTVTLSLKNPSDSEDTVYYKSGEYVIAENHGSGYYGDIELSTKQRNGKLHISTPGKVEAYFIHPTTNQKYNNSVFVNNQSTVDINKSTVSSNESSAPSTPTPTPTPEPTPSPSRVDEDRGDTTPPEITSVIGFPRRVADSGDPLLEV